MVARSVQCLVRVPPSSCLALLWLLACLAPVAAFAMQDDASLPELPRYAVDTTMPVQEGRLFAPASSQELQFALGAASSGDTIILRAGGVYTGPFTLPARYDDGWVVLRSSDMDALPGAGMRITPAHAQWMPKIVTANDGQPALRAANSTRGYRFVGIEFTADANVKKVSALVEISHNSKRIEEVPSHIVFDRVYIHGSPTLESQRGLTLNSQWSAVIDSWIDDCHIHGYDSQAIVIWNGPGPFKIENNFLEGGSENIMFGGAKNTAENFVPSDIEVRRNHLYKDPSWAGLVYPENWVVKNLFEIKCARRVLFEGNVLENCWAEGQSGFAFVLKSASPSQGQPWDTTSDLTLRHNRILNSLHGFSIGRWSSEGPVAPGALPTARILIEHNVFERFGRNSDFANTDTGGILFQVSCDGLTIRHNTAWNSQATLMLTRSGTDNLVFENNLVTPGSYFLHADGGRGAGWDSALQTHLRGNSRMAGNAILRVGDERARKTNAAHYPAGNLWLDSFAHAGVDPDTFALSPGSPLRGKGTDGRNPGADIAAVMAATRNVRAEVP